MFNLVKRFSSSLELYCKIICFTLLLLLLMLFKLLLLLFYLPLASSICQAAYLTHIGLFASVCSVNFFYFVSS